MSHDPLLQLTPRLSPAGGESARATSLIAAAARVALQVSGEDVGNAGKGDPSGRIHRAAAAGRGNDSVADRDVENAAGLAAVAHDRARHPPAAVELGLRLRRKAERGAKQRARY